MYFSVCLLLSCSSVASANRSSIMRLRVVRFLMKVRLKRELAPVVVLLWLVYDVILVGFSLVL